MGREDGFIHDARAEYRIGWPSIRFVEMSAPRLTVLTSVYNEDRYLAATIESVLRQTYTDFEFLILDDGSTDRSRAIAASYGDPRIRIVDNPHNLGLTASLNRGLSMIRSEYVARLDGNDLSFPERLAKQVTWLDAHPEVAVVGVQAVPIDVRGRVVRRGAWWNRQWRKPAGGVLLDWYRMFDTPFFHSGVLFRHEAIMQLGGYDEQQPLAQDAELWMRAGRQYRLANLDEALIAYRIDPDSMTFDLSRPERVGYPDRKGTIVHTLLCEILQWEDVPRRWAELWVEANNPWASLAPMNVRELAVALDACATRFFELHADAKDLTDIATHRASMVARLMEKADRTTMLSLYPHIRALGAKAAMNVLPSLAASFLLGRQRSRFQRRAA